MMFHAASYHPQMQACNSTPVSNGSSGTHMTKLNIDLISKGEFPIEIETKISKLIAYSLVIFRI